MTSYLHTRMGQAIFMIIVSTIRKYLQHHQTSKGRQSERIYKMPPRVLLLGGHGRVSLLMTPLFLSRSWHVTSVIRNPEHTKEIESKGAGLPGKLEVLVDSLDDVKSEQQAQSILDKAKPDWIVWSAGIYCTLPFFPTCTN